MIGRALKTFRRYVDHLAPTYWHATIAFRCQQRRNSSRRDLLVYLQDLDDSTLNGVGWLYVEDRNDNDRMRFQVLIASVDQLSIDVWMRVANRNFGKSRIEICDSQTSVSDYLARNGISEDQIWDLGGSLLTPSPKSATRDPWFMSCRLPPTCPSLPSLEPPGPKAGVHRISIDARGGPRSSYKFHNESTDETFCRRIGGLEFEEALILAFEYALFSVPPGSKVRILTEWRALTRHYKGKSYPGKYIASQLDTLRKIIRKRQLTVTVKYSPCDEDDE